MPTLPFPSRRIDDPLSLKVIAALEAVGAERSAVVLPAMSTKFRDDLRAQLVAVTPRLVAEGVHAATEAPPRAARSATRSATTTAAGRTPSRTRPMTVLVAGAAVVVLGLGGATWLARGALPGDPLYGLKRTAEGVDVSLSGSDFDKGHALLVDAQTRVAEVNSLLGRPQSMAFGSGPSASGAISDSTVKLIVSTLKTADADTRKGVTTIGDDAITRGSTEGLNLVVAWAQGQRDRIDALVARIPSGPAHEQAATSAAEIRTGLQRATDLLVDYSDTTCERSRDAFGPTPCLTPSTTPPAPSGGASGSTPTSGGSAGTSTGTTTGPGSGSSTGASPAPSAAPSGAPSTSSGTAGPVLSVPVLGSSPAVAIDSCGVQVSLPVAGVSLGTCTPGR